MTWKPELKRDPTKIRGEWRFSIMYTDSVTGEERLEHYREPRISDVRIANIARRDAKAFLDSEAERLAAAVADIWTSATQRQRIQAFVERHL